MTLLLILFQRYQTIYPEKTKKIAKLVKRKRKYKKDINIYWMVGANHIARSLGRRFGCALTTACCAIHASLQEKKATSSWPACVTAIAYVNNNENFFFEIVVHLSLNKKKKKKFN